MLATKRERRGERRRDREAQPVPDRVLDARGVQHDDRRDANHAFGADDQAVRAEASVPCERPAGHVLDEVGEERDHEADHEAAVPLEHRVDDRGAERGTRRDQREQDREHETGGRGSSHDRPAADAPGPAVGDGAADLLLEREEEAGREHEHEDPEAVERGVVGLRQRPEREDLEAVGR